MKLSFHGAVRGVTGSCFLLQTEKGKLLVDCGMFQGERLAGHLNFEEFGFDPREIDAVVVTHAHYDHTGRTPLLVRQGFTGNIYMTPPTKAIGMLVLEDAQRVMTENAKKSGDKVLFSMDDVLQVKKMIKGINYHTQFEPVPGFSVMFHEAGHILGSAYATVDVLQKRFVFSGDIGNDNVPILPDTESISEADVIVTESTYGNRDHEPVKERSGKLVEVINKVIQRGGTLLIPAFSVERTQELLYELDRLSDAGKVPSVPYYLDSPLAIRTTEVYREFKHNLEFDTPILESKDHDFFSFPNLKITLSRDDSKSINNDHRPKVIIAGSGMMTGGRILHHLRRYLGDDKSGVLIIGYQAEGSLGRRIFDGDSEVTIHRKKYKVRASVDAIGSFSAHGDRNKLARWLKPKKGSASKIFLVHGDPEVKIEFKEFLKDKIQSEIIIPEFGESFEF